MAIDTKQQRALDALEIRLRTLLPEEYQHCYEDVEPVSMGSAGLKYGADGKVAWDDMWGSFCDLAMAGGPPHKGTLLQPGSLTEIEAEPDRHAQVVAEVCRGITLVTEFPAQPSVNPGWVQVDCATSTAAGWLVRAIVMENISASADGAVLELPAAPNYRIEKEIKNVITVIAKTCHYWADHLWSGQQRDIADLFEKMSAEFPLIQPALKAMPGVEIAEAIHRATGLRASELRYPGWLGLELPNVRSAIWMMRGLVASNVLARRQETVLFVPVNPASDPHGEVVSDAISRIHGFAVARGIL